MRFVPCKAVLAVAAALVAAGVHAGGAALPLAGDQLYALPPEPVVRQVLLQLPQLRLGSLNNELAGAERAKLAAVQS